MKFKIIIIGIALVLMLCISPVAAVYDDWEIVDDNIGIIHTYTYFNKNNPDEEYGVFSWFPDYSFSPSPPSSLVTTTITPICGVGPTMYVPPDISAVIYLPCCFIEWQVKYYYYYG